MMMIMHEPDKKKHRKWLAESLLHFSEPEDWKKKKKKRVFLLREASRLAA